MSTAGCVICGRSSLRCTSNTECMRFRLDRVQADYNQAVFELDRAKRDRDRAESERDSAQAKYNELREAVEQASARADYLQTVITDYVSTSGETDPECETCRPLFDAIGRPVAKAGEGA